VDERYYENDSALQASDVLFDNLENMEGLE
jgi:hypothetical protein